MHTEHSFNIELAKEVGIEKAILLKNIHWWILKNSKNEKNLRDGRYWTYNSSKAFAELFPYMSDASIRRWLIELEEEGWIVTANFNRRKNDKTKWYAVGIVLIQFCNENNIETFSEEITDVQNEQVGEEPELFTVQNERSSDQIEQSIVQNEQPSVQNDQALPDVYRYKQDVAAVVLNGSDGDDLNFIENIKQINLMDTEYVDMSLKKLFYVASVSFSSLSVDRIKNEIVDVREEITKQDAWEIIVESFVEVSGVKESSKNVNYLIAKIQGKKNDLCAVKNKQKYDGSMARIKIDEEDESKKWMELANKEFEMKRKLLTPEAVENIEKLLEEGKHLSVMVELGKVNSQ